MIAKKIIYIALLPLMCASLFACKHSDDDVPLVNNDIGSNMSSESIAVEHPFKEGFYIGENYTLQFVYIGNKTEHSYGISAWDNVNGEEEFFGLVYNVSPKALSLTVPGYKDESAMLFADKVMTSDQSCVIKISDLSENGVSAALCGEYEYGGVEWFPASAKEADIITSGVYIKDEYILNIDRQDSEIFFCIYDGEGEELFNGSSRSRKQDTVMIGSENSYYCFVKCQNGEGVYIDVSAVGYYNECDYLGKYVPKQ